MKLAGSAEASGGRSHDTPKPIPGAYHVARAARTLRGGGVVVHATEAVFGLAARAHDAAACTRVATLKARPGGKPFIVIAADRAELAGLVSFDTPLQDEILASWPGPATWLLPMLPHCPHWLGGPGGLVAVRCTGHGQAAALCAAVGPLISTSANPSGRPPARNLMTARRYFGASVDDYLPGALGGASRPSTIRHGFSGATLRP